MVSGNLNLSSPTGTETSDYIGLNPNESAVVQIERTDAGTTDEMILSIQSTVDGVNWDDSPLSSFRQNPSDGSTLTFTISRPYAFRVKLDGSGVTDTITTVIRYRKDGISR
jgi:hypothetical protein